MACDLMFSVPVGAIGWPAEMHEPLLTGVCFPFLSFKPWQFGGSPKLSQVARQMHGMRDDVEVDRGLVLRKFWGVAHRLLTMPECAVSRVLFFERRDSVSRGDDQLDGKEGRKRRRPIEGELGKKARKDKDKCLKARKGDNMMSPFECDRCTFHKLRGTPSDPENALDKLLLACIRRANLDAFWSRSADTVTGHVGQIRMKMAMADLLGRVVSSQG
jgi:hypothetical protein